MPYTEEFAEIEVRHAFIKKVLHINVYCLGCYSVDVVDDSRFIFFNICTSVSVHRRVSTVH